MAKERKNCPKGTRRNKKTGNCEGTTKKERKNCPAGSRRNKKTGNCDKTATKEAKTVDDMCSICLGVIDEDKYKTECKHTFHSKCLGVWCARMSIDKKTCPYCRKDIRSECKTIEPIVSENIFPYLQKTFTYPSTGAYYYRAVKKEEEDNDRVIQRFLDDPSFDPNVRRYTDGKTPLMCALDTRKCAFAEKIVKRPDIKVNLVDNDNRSALHYSVKIRGCDHVTELLLKHSDINTDIKDDDRSEHEATALHAALKANNSTAVALFKKYKKVPKAMKSLV